MKVAYIAMPYRADSTWEIRRNIQRAEHLAMKYWRLGYAVICPHKNTAHFDGGADDSVWLDGDIEILKRCDVIVMGYNWVHSSGAKNELKEAEAAGLEVIYDDEHPF